MTSRARHSRWVGASIATLLMLGVAMPSAAGATLRAPAVHLLPGLDRVRPSDAAGAGALTRYLPRRLARGVQAARRDAAAAAGRGQRVQVTVLELRTARSARRVVARWAGGARRAGARPRRVRLGADGWLAVRGRSATLVWRSRSAVGVVLLRASGRPSRVRAVAFGRLANAGLGARPPATAWERVLGEVRADGTLSKRTAMKAFALAYGRLPGVPVPRGRRGAIDGTLAAESILRYRSSLTPRQRRVVDRKLGLPRRGRSRAAALDGVPDFPQFKRDETIEGIVEGFVVQFYKLLGTELDPFMVIAGTTPLDIDARADTLPFDADGVGPGQFFSKPKGIMAFCRVRVSEATQKEAQTDPGRYSHTLAHEAFHCVQNAVLGSLVWKKPLQGAWLKEGSADWAATKVNPLSYGDYVSTTFNGLKEFIQHPSPVPPLFELGYGGGMAFFAHLDDAFAPAGFWPRALATLKKLDNDEAFVAAGGIEPAALESWGARRFRLPEGGPAWTMTSPFPPPFVGVPSYHEVSPGDSLIPGFGFVATPIYTTAQTRIAALPGFPFIRLKVDGYARLLSLLGPGVSAPEKVLKDREVWLRAEGDGVCPAGSTGSRRRPSHGRSPRRWR
jgi:hypothetical protein